MRLLGSQPSLRRLSFSLLQEPMCIPISINKVVQPSIASCKETISLNLPALINETKHNWEAQPPKCLPASIICLASCKKAIYIHQRGYIIYMGFLSSKQEAVCLPASTREVVQLFLASCQEAILLKGPSRRLF